MQAETMDHARRGWWRADPSPALRAAEGASQDSPIAFAALVAFTFILILAPQSFFPILKPMRVALLSAAVAIAAQLTHRMFRRQPLVRLTREMYLGMALFGWAVATMPFSYWPGGSLELLLDLYVKALAVFWILGNVVTTAARLQFTCWALTLMSFPIAIAGIENFLSGEYLWNSANTRIFGYGVAGAGLTRNPNDLALMLNLLLPLSAGLFGTARSASARAALAGAIILDAAAIILTFSRAGFLTLATSCAILLVGFARRQQWKPVIGMAALGFLCLPFLPQGYVDRLETIADVESDPTGSAQERWRDTISSAQLVLENPIVGAGAGMNILALNEARGPAWKMVHNAYLEYGVDLGLPGLILFVLLLVYCYQTAKAVWKRSQESPALCGIGEIAYGIRVSLAAFAVAAFFHPVAYSFYFFYLAGLALAVRAAYEDETGHSLFHP